MCSMTIILLRCVVEFSFMFLLKTLVESKTMKVASKSFFFSTYIDECKKRTKCQCVDCHYDKHGVTMIVITQVMTSST